MTDKLLDDDDDRRLELTQRIREKYLLEMDAEEGRPGSTGDKVLLVQLLDGMDKSVLNKTKIRIESESAKDQVETSRLIAEVLLKHKVESKPRENIPELPDDLPDPMVVSGELEQGISDLDYEKFMSEQKS